VKKKNSVPGLVHQASGKVDYGSPTAVVDAARLTMGGIDLDVASAPYWNKRIKARRYWHIYRVHRWFHHKKHPLDRDWCNFPDRSPARIWMNHPYGRKENVDWISKVIEEFYIGNVAEACVLTFAEQSTKWGKILRAFPRWIPDRRLAHYDEHGRPIKGSVKGSMVTYIAPHEKWGNFFETFVMLLGGSVDIPAEYHFEQVHEILREGIDIGKSVAMSRQGASDNKRPMLWIEGNE